MKALFLTIILLAGSAFANTNHIHVKVDGLVCDFCARALEKVFSKEESVENITVNLDGGYVAIKLKDGMDISDEKLQNLITDSGYNITDITRKGGHE